MKDVIVIGEVCEDIIMHDPGAVEVMGAKIWARDIVSTIGGSASFAATAFAHLGEKVQLHSSIGNDFQGKMLYDLCIPTKRAFNSMTWVTQWHYH